MKAIIYFISILLICASCQPQLSEEQAKEVMEGIQEIPLSYDSVVGGKIDLTKNFYFIFDQSGSMAEYCSNEEKINVAKKAIIETMKNLSSQVNVGLMVIGSNTATEYAELLPIGVATDAYKKRFTDIITDIEPLNGTPLVQAIKLVVDKLVIQKKKQLGYGEYRIIVITDGEATDGDVQEAAVYAIQYAMGIYTIGLCIDTSHPLYQFSVSYHDAENYDELKNALASVTAETTTFDSVAYDSTAYNQ